MSPEQATQSRILEFEDAFNWLQVQIYDTACKHGFHENEYNPLHLPTKLALIMSEASEALEAHRKRQDEEIPSELADIVIRTMDLAASLDIDLAKAITDKAQFNSLREYKHGNKRY